ncbi:hypothetical protein CEP51_001098 [Fusarium floridanum]|uniref:NADPH-dependent FMN reductase-like domain-containing protein n=1 Tax=Fusarium floridanum TaxID=1325733 RepID=A0A428SJ11_9HYPO|nr:hypothetical protein CEP51_001098 [Fusarium floridanum]
MDGHGDLNNSHAGRAAIRLAVDPASSYQSLAISSDQDDVGIREKYRPFLLNGSLSTDDWISELELSTVIKMVQSEILDTGLDRLRILVLYGSLRSRSYSRLLAYEAARILFRLGCDVRVFDPAGLPQKDDVQHCHPKVQELRELSIFKQQIDWIPLSSGSVRPTQGRTLAIAQVSGGSQSFNAVNSLRILGRWMRMFVIPNQSSVPKAYTQFTSEPEGSRMIASSNRDRLVDCMEELVKYTIVMRPHFDLFGDRFSEREERRGKETQGEVGK